METIVIYFRAQKPIIGSKGKEYYNSVITVIQIMFVYYAPPSRPEGPRHCPDRGNAGGALVFSQELWLLYAMGVYTCRKIHPTN